MTAEDTADFYAESDWALILRARGLRQGRQEGRQEGREENREGRARILLALLRTRFGDHPGLAELAERLSRIDEAAAVEAVTAAASVEDIVID